MEEKIEARSRRAPFLWASSAAFRLIVESVPERERQSVGWVYTCLAATASEAFDGSHQGFGSTAGEIQALTGLSRPTFRKALQTLESLGLLLRENRTAESGRTMGVRYILLEPDQQGGKPVATRQETAADVAPPARASKNGKNQNLSLTGENARKPVSYRGRRVPVGTVETAEGLLAVFNEQTGRGLTSRKQDGTASDMLKQIIGAVLERPAVTREEWARAVVNTVANPPSWLDGQMQIGHVFGGRAVEYALANEGQRVLNAAGRGESVVERNMSQAERWARGQV